MWAKMFNFKWKDSILILFQGAQWPQVDSKYILKSPDIPSRCWWSRWWAQAMGVHLGLPMQFMGLYCSPISYAKLFKPCTHSLLPSSSRTVASQWEERKISAEIWVLILKLTLFKIPGVSPATANLFVSIPPDVTAYAEVCLVRHRQSI